MKSYRIMQWLIPTTVLVAFIIVMFLLFSAKVERKGQSIVEKNVVMSGEEAALRVEAELKEIETAVEYTADIMDDYGAIHNIKKNLANKLFLNTPAYMVCIVNGEGSGVGSYSTTLVDIGKQTYFYHIENGDHWFYAGDDGIKGKSAMVYVSEVSDDLYVLAYYDVKSAFENIELRNEHYTKDAFYVLTDEKLNVLASQGENEVYLSEENIKTVLETNKDNTIAAQAMAIDFRNKLSGSQEVVVEGDSRNFCYAPVGIGDMYIIIGLNSSYVIAEGSEYYQEATSMLFTMIIAIGVFFFLVVIINLIFKAVDKKQKNDLQIKADTDLLTGLTNKTATERLINEYIRENPNGSGVLYIIDVDNFKKINDTMGHAFGDEVLKELGQQLRSMFRALDVVGRFGGDEFLVFMKGVEDPNVIKRHAARLKDFFHNFTAGEYVKYSVGASIGAAVYSENGKDFESIFKMADKALYVVKRNGKNDLAFYSDVKDEAESQLIDYHGREE